jgi:cellobiose dehydrogenase (acceptor)
MQRIASMTITQYLGTGTTSRGRMGITPSLSTRVMTAPYLRDTHDKEAVIQGIEYIRGVLSQVQNLTWVVPTATQNTTAFVNLVSSVQHSVQFSHEDYTHHSRQIPATTGSRSSNHWIGSCTIGTDDGRVGGKAVVDLDTKVYGVRD